MFFWTFTSKSKAKKSRNYSSFIKNKIYPQLPRFQKITVCRFITWFTKNCNLQGFKELQYVDLQLDLQGITTWKVVRYFFKSFKQVLRTVTILSWFVLDFFGSLLFVLYSSGRAAMSQALSQLHIPLIFQNKKF